MSVSTLIFLHSARILVCSPIELIAGAEVKGHKNQNKFRWGDGDDDSSKGLTFTELGNLFLSYSW